MDEQPPAVGNLSPAECARVLAARDPRFDGLFYVGITSTGVYCRPICPARVTHHDRRRFYRTAAEAEHAGFRPCLRCRPELAPGRSVAEAVSRLAREATDRIAAGALNGRSVAALAADLGVSERHLRRALERELGVSPVELAQTHRLLLAKRLLADTVLPVTRIAYASGFQSLRRFNTTFRERYRMSPSDMRRARRGSRSRNEALPGALPDDPVRLTLSYREPLAWRELLVVLRDEALPGVERVDDNRYVRAVQLRGHAGLVAVQPHRRSPGRPLDAAQLDVWLSQDLVPVTMPLLARLRRQLDLDAEPTRIDEALRQGVLEEHVRHVPGVRVPGSLGGFEAVFRTIMRGNAGSGYDDHVARVVQALGAEVYGGDALPSRCVPTRTQVLAAGIRGLRDLGVPAGVAAPLLAIARGIHEGTLHIDRGADPRETHGQLLAIDGITDAMAMAILARGLSWPDAFSASDPVLATVTGASSPTRLAARAERWRPWRAYAALRLRLLATAERDSHRLPLSDT